MELAEFSRIIMSFAAIIAMIGVSALVANKAGLANGGLTLNKDKRLAVVETAPIDARRRAAILKCDDREYLIMLGASGEVVVDPHLTNAEPVSPISQTKAPDSVFDPGLDIPPVPTAQIQIREEMDERAANAAETDTPSVQTARLNDKPSFAQAMKKLTDFGKTQNPFVLRNEEMSNGEPSASRVKSASSADAA